MTDRAGAVWAARRALAERAPPTLARLAQACRVSLGGLEQRARREGWKLSDAAAGFTRAERIARVHDRLLDRIEQAQRQAEDDDAPIDKGAIAELSATARMLTKISEGMRDEDAANEQQMERDADIAAILDRLDAKVVELARHLAQELAREGIPAAGAVQGEP